MSEHVCAKCGAGLSCEQALARVASLEEENRAMREALRSIIKVARAEPPGTALDTVYTIARECFDALRGKDGTP